MRNSISVHAGRLSVLIAMFASACSKCVPSSSPAPHVTPVGQAEYAPLDFGVIGNFNIDQIFPNNASVPESALRHNGQKVAIVGEMIVTDSDKDAVYRFVLCEHTDARRSWPPVLQKQILVHAVPEKPVRRHDRWLVRAYGTLEVGVREDPETKATMIYQLRLDRLEPLRSIE